MTEHEDSIKHFHKCERCGRLVDRRQLVEVFAHEEDPCPSDDEIETRKKASGSFTARRVGDDVEWRDGKPTHLN
jgi:hypothetical protein